MGLSRAAETPAHRSVRRTCRQPYHRTVKRSFALVPSYITPDEDIKPSGPPAPCGPIDATDRADRQTDRH